MDHTRWEDDPLSEHGCFAWLSGWACAPTHTIAAVMELYEQLLPTRVYAAFKTGTSEQMSLTPCAECAVRYTRKPCSRFGAIFIAGAD